MRSWFSKLFSSIDDDILKALAKDPTIFDGIKKVSKSYHETFNIQTKIDDITLISEKITGILGTMKLHQIVVQCDLLNDLVGFIEPLLVAIQSIPPKSLFSGTLIYCTLYLLQITNEFPQITFNRIPIILCQDAIEFPDLRDSIDSIMSILLAKKEFVQPLMTVDFFKDCFETLLKSSCFSDLVPWFTQKMAELIPVGITTSLDVAAIVNYFLYQLEKSKVPKENVFPSVQLLIAFLRSDVTNIENAIDLLKINKGFNRILSSMIANAPEQIFLVFSELSTICYRVHPPVIDFLYETVNDQKTATTVIGCFYSVFAEIMICDNYPLESLNTMYTPTSLFILKNLERSDGGFGITQIFALLANRKYPEIKDLIRPEFDIIARSSRPEKFIQLMSTTLLNITQNEAATFDEINQLGFLELFFFAVPAQTLALFLQQASAFVSVVFNIYCIITDVSKHWAVLKRILETEKDFEVPTRFTQLASSFFSGRSSIEMAQHLMDYIRMKPSEDLISIFITSFSQNVIDILYFIDAGGLDWVSAMMIAGAIIDHQLLVLLLSMSIKKTYNKINDWIISLPTDHPIFQLPMTMLINIVFGSPTAMTSVKVPALLPLIPIPLLHMTPHSAYRTSKYAMGEFIRHGTNLDSNANVAMISNRYLTPEQFRYILKESKLTVAHANRRCDHFPLFEFTPGEEGSFFGVSGDAIGVSFWVKVESPTNNRIVVMSSDIIDVSIEGNSMKITSHVTSISVDIKVGNWTMVYISTGNDYFQNTADIYINDKYLSLDVGESDDSLSSIVFGCETGVLSDIFFLGAAVRLYQEHPPEPKAVFQGGPGSLLSYVSGEFIVSPYSIIQRKGTGVRLVPYRGFPMYANLGPYYWEVVEAALDAPNSNRLFDLLQMMTEVYFINKRKRQRFWAHVIMIMKEKNALVTRELFDYVVEKISISSEAGVMPLLSDVDMWYLFPTAMSEVLFKYARGHKLMLTSMVGIPNDSRSIIKAISKLGLFEFAMDLMVYSEVDVQIQIVECLIDELESKSKNISELTKVFDLNTCSNLMYVLPASVSTAVFKYITVASMTDPNFFSQGELDPFVMFKILDTENLFPNMFSVLSSNNLSQNLVNTQIFPVLLASVLAGLIVSFAANSALDDSDKDDDSSPFNSREETDEETISESFSYSTSMESDRRRRRNGRKLLEEFDNQLYLAVNILTVSINAKTELLLGPSISGIITFLIPLITNMVYLRKAAVDVNAMEEPLRNDEVFTRWCLPKPDNDIVEIPMFPVSLSPYLAALVPIVQRFAPGFDFQEKVALPSEERQNALIAFWVSLVNPLADTDKFEDVAKAVIYQDPLHTRPEFSGMIARTLMILIQQAFTWTPSTAVAFFGLIERLDPERITPELVADVCEYVSSGRMHIGTETSIRILFLKILEGEKGSIKRLLETIVKSKTKIIGECLFSHEFGLAFLGRILKLNDPRNPLVRKVTSLITNYLQRTAKQSPLENIVEFLDGIAIYGMDFFPEWVSAHREFYDSYLDKCIKMGDLLLKESEDRSDSEFAVADMMKMIDNRSTEVQKRQHYLTTELFLKKHDVGYVISVNRETMLRTTEYNDSVVFFEFSKYTASKPYKPSSYTLGSAAWPGNTPRVMTPSRLALPQIPLEKCDFEKEFVFKMPEARPYFEIPTLDMFPRSLTVFHEIERSKITPTRYAGRFSTDPKLCYQTFTSGHAKNPKRIYNASFLRYTEPVSSPVFVLSDRLIILIGARVEADSLLLEQKPKSAATFAALAQQMALQLFGTPRMFCGHFVLSIRFSHIVSANIRNRNYVPCAVELSTQTRCDFILVFEKTVPSIFKQLMLKQTESPSFHVFRATLPSVTTMWTNREISTYTYLLALNRLSGRSFFDISSYPVFPWVISDYTSPKGPTGQRNLSKPMGMLSDERAQLYRAQFQSMHYHYGGHYSVPAGIHFYMMRTPPYSFLDWDLHQGWDNLARVFFDVGYSWMSSSSINANDVKELIPEFFTVPAIFENECGFPVGSVKLPAWAKSSSHFVLTNRKYLDMSQQMEQWIDLIFGEKQKGEAAVAAENTFLPVSYYSPPAPDDDIQTLALQLENWGQCPLQLFTKPHPSRPKIKEDDLVLLEDMRDEDPLSYTDGILQLTAEPLTKSDFPAKTARKLSSSICDGILTISQTSLAMAWNNVTLCRRTAFSTARELAISANGDYCVVDTDTNVALVFAIHFQGGKPVAAFDSGIFGLPEKATTRINGTDFLCASFVKNEIIMWDFIRCVFHRHLKFETEVIGCSFDELLGLLWVLTLEELFLFGINGELIAKTPVKNSTAIVCEEPPEGSKLRPVFISTACAVAAYVYDIQENAIVELTDVALRSGGASMSAVVALAKAPSGCTAATGAGQFFAISFSHP